MSNRIGPDAENSTEQIGEPAVIDAPVCNKTVGKKGQDMSQCDIENLITQNIRCQKLLRRVIFYGSNSGLWKGRGAGARGFVP